MWRLLLGYNDRTVPNGLEGKGAMAKVPKSCGRLSEAIRWGVCTKTMHAHQESPGSLSSSLGLASCPLVILLPYSVSQGAMGEKQRWPAESKTLLQRLVHWQFSSTSFPSDDIPFS
jgi:hypothetical protein